MSEAFELYEYEAPSEKLKREYHAEPLTEEEWPHERLLHMGKLTEILILVSECERTDSHYFLESRNDKRIGLIEPAHLDALYGWVNKFDKDDVRKNPAFYHEVIKEINKRRNGHL